LQQQLLSAKIQIESQTRQILSLEAALEERSGEAEGASTLATLIDAGAPREESDNESVIEEQARRIVELEEVVRGYEVGGRAHINEEEVKRDVEKKVRAEVERKIRDEMKEELEREWTAKIEGETRKREEGERWAKEVVRQLEKEKKVCGVSRFFGRFPC
jgi:centromeric protein E